MTDTKVTNSCRDCGVDCLVLFDGYCIRCDGWRAGYGQGAREVMGEILKRDPDWYKALVKKFPAWDPAAARKEG